MSGDLRFLQEAIPSGQGVALDLGGGRGLMRPLLEKLGYRYLNLDVQRLGNGAPTVLGDAHALPLVDRCLDLVVSKDSLEHFLQPSVVVDQVLRVLKPGGRFVIWVPFMHPFHGNDYWRFTPLGLQEILKDFTIERLESPLGAFSVVGLVVVEFAKRMGMVFLESFIKTISWHLDRLVQRLRTKPRSFAAAYLIVAYKSNEEHRRHSDKQNKRPMATDNNRSIYPS